MHNNYYFLRQLSGSLEKTLKGTVISECFSQSKDELVFRFETYGDPFFLKASLLPSFSCLSFPSNFQRARKNSVDLFPKLIGYRIIDIRQFNNERSFALLLEEEIAILFKMHGNRSNIVMFERGHVVAVFRNNIPADLTLTLDSLDRDIDFRYETFLQHDSQNTLPSLYFTFGKPVWQYLTARGFDSKTPSQKWEDIQHMLKTLDKPLSYYIVQTGHSLHLTLLSQGTVLGEFNDPLKAINEFFYTYTHRYTFLQEKAKAVSAVQAKLQSSDQYYQKTFNKLIEVESDNHYKVWADLIMANLHQLKTGMEKTVLPNFYADHQTMEIKLKKDLSPQKNAEAYYRKAKNHHIEIERLQQALKGKETEIETLKVLLQRLEATTDLKSLRSVVAGSGLSQAKEKQAAPMPYHEFEYQGFKIWVGRNAQSNDVLTHKYGYKEDLWLHAKDVSGSHVLIKYQSGKNYPKDVIECAAGLAAYNSKRKNESLCPVIVTPRKFVRKRKGDPAGAVVIEREEIILVEPKLFQQP